MGQDPGQLLPQHAEVDADLWIHFRYGYLHGAGDFAFGPFDAQHERCAGPGALILSDRQEKNGLEVLSISKYLVLRTKPTTW